MTNRLSAKSLFLLFAVLATAYISYGASNVSDGEDIGISIMGTITHSSGEDNVALVKETSSGKILAVKPNFMILKKYKVKEVTGKYIVLVEANKEYLVYQSKFAGEFLKPTKSNQPLAGISPLSNAYSEAGFERNDGKITVTEGYLNKVLTDDISQVLMQATALPKYENGKILGFTILQIDPGSIFEKAGLRDNDVVTAINDKPLNSISGAIQILKSVRNQKNVKIEFLRDNNAQQLDIQVH